MNRLKQKESSRAIRANRVKKSIASETKINHLVVSVSNTNIQAQILDTTTGKTVLTVISSKMAAKGSKTEKATAVGTEIAKQAVAKGIKKVRFDRGHKLYHGRVKALAEAARAGGLEF